MLSAPVIVVGLGPVGAVLALLLADQGVPVEAIERNAESYPFPRAVALDDEALRVLQAVGATAEGGLELLAGGSVRLRGRDGACVLDLPPVPTVNGHPSLAFFHQPQLEQLLRARLDASPLIRVRVGCEVTDVRQSGDAVRVSVRGPSGHEELAGSHVVGCDGARSTIRNALGVRLAGRSAGTRWLVVNTGTPAVPAAGTGGRSASGFEFVGEPLRPWVHGPLPAHAHRWEFMLGPDEPAVRMASAEVVNALLAERLQGPPPPVLRAAVYTFRAQIATRWRVGRVLLAGDAAHLAPPFAGQGLGAGLRDAHNLAWKLAAVRDGRAAGGLLDSYARERAPHVLRMTALAAGLGAVVQTRRPRAAATRDRLVRGLAQAEPVRSWIAAGGYRPPARFARGLVAGQRALRHRAGELLPQPVITLGTGHLPLDSALGPAFSLIGIGTDPTASFSRADRLNLEELGVTPLRIGTPGPVDPADVLADWLAPARIALVRPDRVIFGTATPQDAATLLAALRAALRGHRRTAAR